MRSPLLNTDEVAAYLRRSKASFRWMIHNGTAPKHTKIGGRLYWREQDVIDWINAQFEEAS